MWPTACRRRWRGRFIISSPKASSARQMLTPPCAGGLACVGASWAICCSTTSAAAKAASSTSSSSSPALGGLVESSGQPVLTPEVQKKLIDSVHAEVGLRSIAELEAQRDEVLLGLLELRAKAEQMPARSAARVG